MERRADDMRSAVAGIDHVIVGVRSLEEARRRWGRLGFALSPRGHHIGRNTANYCLMFGADYVELLGVVEPPESPSPQAGALAIGTFRLDAFLATREGLMAAALLPAGTVEAARKALLRQGLHPAKPRLLERRIELAEAAATPRFSLVALPPHETPGLECFLCEPLTPELLRRPEWLRHPNGAIALEGLYVLVESTAALLAPYDRLFGLPNVTTTDAIVVVRAGRHRIVFSTPDDFETMHPAFDFDREFPLPGIAALEIGVARAGDTADFLARQRIAFTAMPDGSLAVPASEACGAVLFFCEG
jgi:catechol 2,3-dioxygenase-like lactoylglutathione lyase family enzyme